MTFLASATTSSLGAGIIAFMLYGVALIGGMVEQIGALLAETGSSAAGAMLNLGIVSSLILPTDVLYRRASYLLLAGSGDLWHGLGSMGPFGVASVLSRWMVFYAGVYLVVCLFMAIVGEAGKRRKAIPAQWLGGCPARLTGKGRFCYYTFKQLLNDWRWFP